MASGWHGTSEVVPATKEETTRHRLKCNQVMYGQGVWKVEKYNNLTVTFENLRGMTNLYIGCGPLPVTVTTRIITFLIGNPYKP